MSSSERPTGTRGTPSGRQGWRPRRRDEFWTVGWSTPSALLLLVLETVSGPWTVVACTVALVLGIAAYHVPPEPPARR